MRLLLILLMLSLSVSSVSAEEAVSKKITLVCNNKPNPPFVLGNGMKIDWKKPGISLEVLKLIENKLNVELHFIRKPWARGLSDVRYNKADGIFHSSFKPERLEFGVYPMKAGEPDPSRQLMSMSYFLYKLQNSPLQWDGKQLRHLNGKIGAIIGFAIVNDLEKMGVQVEEVPSQLSNLRKLVLGRVAGVADLETLTDFQIRSHPEEFKDIVKVFPPLRAKPYYLMFSHKFVKDNPEISEGIWNTIKEIRETGQYDRIAQKYLQTPESP